jgi:hypothetical protein
LQKQVILNKKGISQFETVNREKESRLYFIKLKYYFMIYWVLFGIAITFITLILAGAFKKNVKHKYKRKT